MYYAEHHTEWNGYDGCTVKIDGLKCRLSVTVRRIRYPYDAEVIDVTATPINRQSAEYRRIRAELGDDWSTDVLSSPELSADVLTQLAGIAGAI